MIHHVRVYVIVEAKGVSSQSKNSLNMPLYGQARPKPRPRPRPRGGGGGGTCLLCPYARFTYAVGGTK